MAYITARMAGKEISDFPSRREANTGAPAIDTWNTIHSPFAGRSMSWLEGCALAGPYDFRARWRTEPV